MLDSNTNRIFEVSQGLAQDRRRELQPGINHFLKHSGVTALHVPRGENQRYFALAGELDQLFDQFHSRRGGKLPAIFAAKLIPLFRLMAVPLAERSGGRKLPHPSLDFEFAAAEAARPQTVHQDALAIAFGWLLVNSFDGDQHYLPY